MSTQRAIPCAIYRGGTSKGLYFHASDLPSDLATRDAVLLAAMGSPDPREIDGMGGAHPLTSKVAIISPSPRSDFDVEYLFLQVWPDRAEVSDAQNCGNLLAGVGPFAIEEAIVHSSGDETPVRIWMQNTQSGAVATVQTPGGSVRYDGDTHIDGVPGSHAPIPIEFLDVAGSSCGALLPTERASDVIGGFEVTLIDNGMPVVCVRASDFGLSGDESPAEIESRSDICARVEELRLAAGEFMNLGDVSQMTVPKVSLLAPAMRGGTITTRTFIPRRVHEAIGVFGAVSVATAVLLPGSVAHAVSGLHVATGEYDLAIEHPSGYFSLNLDVAMSGETVSITRAALVRTARLLMRGEVFVPSLLWGTR